MKKPFTRFIHTYFIPALDLRVRLFYVPASLKRITALLLTALLLLASCTGEKATAPTPEPSVSSPPNLEEIDIIYGNDEYDDHFVYPFDGRTMFALDENGVVYALNTDNCRVEYDPEDQTKVISTIIGISAYGLDGKEAAAYELEGNIDNFCVGGGLLIRPKVEQIENGGWETQGFFFYDLETREQRESNVPLPVNPMNIQKLAYLDGTVYMMAIHEDYINADYELWEGTRAGMEHEGVVLHGGYRYDGQILMAYDIETGVFEIIFDELLQDFSITPGGLIMLQAYDSTGGIYFADFDPKTRFTGARIYRDIQQPGTFATDGYGVMFTANAGYGMMPTPGNLYYWPLGEDTGITELSKGHVTVYPGNLAYRNGFTFFIRSYESEPGSRSYDAASLERVKNSAYISYQPAVQIIGVSLQSELPRDGHNISFSTLDYDEFALNVLSGGVSYDIAYIGTRQDFAHNIREKGSFYPLNGVPGVQAYLDACFPYVRDAATDKDGNIWMIPIDISVDAIVYQKENCKKADIDFESAASVEDIVRAVQKGAAYGKTGKNHFFNPRSLQQAGISKYLRTHGTLDTPEFRRTAEALKDLGREFTGTAAPYLDNPEFLFDNISLQTSPYIVSRDDLYVIPVTGTDGAPGSASVVFLCVNPGSDKLDKTLAYISSVCESVSNRVGKPYMFSDRSAYPGSEYAGRLHALYQNAVIDFNVSDEVFADDFDRYLQEKMTLDELIKEADRKIRMYLNE